MVTNTPISFMLSLAGAVNVHDADISVEGTTSFIYNSAQSTGGENGHETEYVTGENSS